MFTVAFRMRLCVATGALYSRAFVAMVYAYQQVSNICRHYERSPECCRWMGHTDTTSRWTTCADRRGHARVTQKGPHAQLISEGRLTECTASGCQGCDFVFSDPPQKAWNDGANYHVMPQIGPVYCHTNRRE